MELDKSFLHLPIGIVSKVDVGRLLREVEGLDSFLQQAAIREPGTPVKLPKTSRLLEADRLRLLNFVKEVKMNAPVLHMSFSADPSPLFLQRLMTWMRSEIHPLVLLQVGLQPNIGAGCILRTTNQYFDFSLKQRFIDKREILANKLKSVPA
jgi:hypothetical protein